MANRLITIDEAARDLATALDEGIKELRAEGVPNDKIARAIEDTLALMGGFPLRGVEA